MILPPGLILGNLLFRILLSPSPMATLHLPLLQTGVLYLQLESEQHRMLGAMVRAHEVGGLAGAAPRPTTFSQQSTPMQFDFYSRSCCLMYR